MIHKLYLLVTFLGIFTLTGSQAQENLFGATPVKASENAQADAAKAAALSADIETRLHPETGKVSYVKKERCPLTGKVTFAEVEYCLKSRQFVKVYPQAKSPCRKSAESIPVEKVNMRLSQELQTKGPAGPAQKAACTSAVIKSSRVRSAASRTTLVKNLEN